MVCSACGKESADEFGFCPYCGKALAASLPATEPLGSSAPLSPISELEAKSPAFAPSSGSDKIGTYVFGAFSVISVLVSLIKGIVPIYLGEAVIWAACAWYWHRKKTHSDLAKAIVIVLAVLVAVGEVIQIASQFMSESKRTVASVPNLFDQGLASQPHGTEPGQAVTTPEASAASQVAEIENQTAMLLVMCDLACNWKLDGDTKGHMDAGGLAKAKVELGQHALVAVTDDGLDKVEKDIEIKTAGQTIVRVVLQPARNDRIQAQQDADPAYLRNHAAERAKEGQSLYNQKRYQEAKPILEKACNGGEMAACVTLGAIYDPAGGADSFNSDLPMARSLFQKGCDNGVMLGCTRLGMTYDFGNETDYNKASSLYEKACDGGDMWGCNNLAGSYESGRGEPKDHSRALTLYQKACKGGFDWACHNLSNLQYPSQ